MNLNDYQNQALTYRLPTASPEYALVNLSGEVGELHSLIAKAIRDGVSDQEAYFSNVKKELGDILWTLSAVAMDHGFSMAEVARVNLEKLESRKVRQVLMGSGDDR